MAVFGEKLADGNLALAGCELFSRAGA